MKRSEAIAQIVNVLRLTGNHYCDDGRDEQDAARILKRLELIGMSPPPVVMHSGYEFADSLFWEKEEDNEEK